MFDRLEQVKEDGWIFTFVTLLSPNPFTLFTIYPLLPFTFSPVLHKVPRLQRTHSSLPCTPSSLQQITMPYDGHERGGFRV